MSRMVVVVDCESTGLGESDRPICIGALLVELDDKGRASIKAQWYGEQEPTVPISPGAFAVHGRTVESLRGQSFDLIDLGRFLGRADTVIAHNAAFDHRMIGRVLPSVQELHWHCSYRQWPWPIMENRKLETVRTHFQIPAQPHHHALDDAIALHQALSFHSGKTPRSATYYVKLLRQNSWIAGRPPGIEQDTKPSRAEAVVEWADREFLAKHCQPGSIVRLKLDSSGEKIIGCMKKFFVLDHVVVILRADANEHIAKPLREGHRVAMVANGNDRKTVTMDVKVER